MRLIYFFRTNLPKKWCIQAVLRDNFNTNLDLMVNTFQRALRVIAARATGCAAGSSDEEQTCHHYLLQIGLPVKDVC
jgi:hypothetical protein